ncbi:hypothetical protein SAMN02745136_01918 [Anaerocolumna jejuensis DSM 15929]|uniref:Alpha/beta hydrolase family protein n=1 Tax=Anaerocolumna jejuensis DSM 15929 TaxID=1121322 RepID=A0A1M6Q9C4_9FIRM|nr:hypothetical protein [Anaerocolumna jejuensis]SHK16748.1 hypothetical protein SAMN02745136_01918 [Anaerocolumna jejuensis DSM 15929]
MNTPVIKTTFKMDNMEYLCCTAGLEQNGELVIFLHGFPESSIILEKQCPDWPRWAIAVWLRIREVIRMVPFITISDIFFDSLRVIPEIYF